MSKYFKEEASKKIKLSEYLKKEIKISIVDEKARVARTKYLIELLGDVSMEEDIYKAYMSSFQRFGGKYDVRTRKDTLKDIYDITEKYPYLTETAIDEIWFTYIRDLYEEYQIMSALEKYIEMFGKSDEAFELFIDYVEKKTEQHSKKYTEESLKVEEYLFDYTERFKQHLKSLILRQHYTYDEIEKILPSSELIEKDEKHISEISAKTRIFFGCCIPVSHSMFETLLEEKTLDTYPETPAYYISTGTKESATFTKTEFLESIQKSKTKKLKK